jgi:hypothetical protein
MVQAIKKIGLVVDYFSFRSDMREFIRELSGKCDLVLYISGADEELIKGTGYKYRVITPKPCAKNTFLAYCYKVFRHKHGLHKDSIEWKMRKLASPFGLKQALQILLFRLYELIPGLLGYDRYLTLLDPDDNNVSDLAAMIFFTDIKNDSLMASCIKSGIRRMVYVYSWDHPVKLTKLPKNGTIYFVWSQEMSDDLQYIHNIDAKKITIAGSTQLSYVFDYLQEKAKVVSSLPEPYIYMVATKGRKEMVSQEIDMINLVIGFLDSNDLPHSIVFRPYPNMGVESQNIVDEMIRNKRVIVDEYRGGDFIFTRDKVMDKYRKIDNSELVIHTGGTFGVEACLLSKVCLYFDFSASNLPSQERYPFYLNIRSVSNQYHLRKYLRLADKNVITDEATLAEALETLLINKTVDSFSEYSRNVSTMFPICAMSDVVDEFSRCPINES